jgi:hypothetical protein
MAVAAVVVGSMAVAAVVVGSMAVAAVVVGSMAAVVVVVDSTAVVATVVADTGNSFRSSSKRSGCRISSLQPLFRFKQDQIDRYPNRFSASLVAS